MAPKKKATAPKKEAPKMNVGSAVVTQDARVSTVADSLGTLGILPPEIRHEIAKLVFLTEAVRLSWKGYRAHPLTKVSRQLRAETIYLFYRHSTFFFKVAEEQYALRSLLRFRKYTPKEFIGHAKKFQAYFATNSHSQHIYELDSLGENALMPTPEELDMITHIRVGVDSRGRSLALPKAILQSHIHAVEFVGSPELVPCLDVALKLCRHVCWQSSDLTQKLRALEDTPELKKLLGDFTNRSVDSDWAGFANGKASIW